MYGGPTMSVAKLSEELTKAGEDVTVLTTTANGKTELEVSIGQENLVDGVKVYYFKRLTKDHTHFSPTLLWFLHQTIKNTKRQTPNNKLIIHIHAWWNLVSIFSCLVAKLHGVRVILSPRGMLNEYTLNHKNSTSKRIIHLLIGKLLLKHANFHATSKLEAQDIRHFLHKEAKEIPNFVKLPQIENFNSLSNEYYNLLFLGRINKIKGLENLFLALSKLKIKWHLSIAGEGDSTYISKLQEIAELNKIQNHIKWLGHVNYEEKFKLIQSSDLLVLPSFKENFANVIIEALAVGTPVLLNNQVGLADYVIQTELGWVTKTNAPEQLTKAIETSYIEKAERIKIRKKAPMIIKRDFNENKLVNDYLMFYKQTTIE